MSAGAESEVVSKKLLQLNPPDCDKGVRPQYDLGMSELCTPYAQDLDKENPKSKHLSLSLKRKSTRSCVTKGKKHKPLQPTQRFDKCSWLNSILHSLDSFFMLQYGAV